MELLISPGTEYIRDGLYSGSKAQRLVLPDSLRAIGSEAFSGCGALRELRLPPGLTELGPAAFMGCAALERLELGGSLTVIDQGAFVGCAALRSVELPASLRSIGAMAFWGSGLERVTVPESVESIGESAFWECESLREANVLGPDTAVGDNAFGSCYRLTRGYIAPGYCGKTDAPAELLYTLLWCSCPEKHDRATGLRAREYIRRNRELILERILKYDNTAAMTGLAAQGLLAGQELGGYVRRASEQGLTEMTALLLKAMGTERDLDGEFEL